MPAEKKLKNALSGRPIGGETASFFPDLPLPLTEEPEIEDEYNGSAR